MDLSTFAKLAEPGNIYSIQISYDVEESKQVWCYERVCNGRLI